MLDQRLSLLEKIGEWISALLLGKTKEIIIRTDEGVRHLVKTTDHLLVMTDEIKKSLER